MIMYYDTNMYYKCFYIFAFLCLYICVFAWGSVLESVLTRENVCVFMCERERDCVCMNWCLCVRKYVSVIEKECVCVSA